jgi:hypothetical protein
VPGEAANVIALLALFSQVWMRDESAPVERRDEMANAAAPYVHPRLATIEYSGTLGGKPPEHMTDEELALIASGGSKVVRG